MWRLSTEQLQKGRNITTDNYFTSSSLALEENRTTIVGTMRHNKREVPPAAKSKRGMHRHESHYRHENMILCFFLDKKKPMLVLSTMHTDAAHEQEKPQKL